MNPWRPIKDTGFVARAAEALQAVLRDLELIHINDGSLCFGHAGLSLLYAEASAFLASPPLSEKSAESIEFAYNILEELPLPSLFHGFVGVGFVLQCLKAHFEVPEDNLRELDLLLLERLEVWEGDYELLVGLLGVGVYALERASSPEAEQLLARVLALVEQASTQTNAGTSWFTRPEHAGPEYPEGNYNLGMAHGLPGVISFLSKLIPHPTHTGTAKRLLQGAVSELLSTETAQGFPSVHSPDRSHQKIPPPTWAYGGAGIAISLWLAAEATQNESWRRDALRIAYRAAQAHPDLTPSAGLCQGKAGAGHIFLRLYQYTGDPLFLGAAQKWLTAVLNSRTPGTGVGGFHSLVSHRLNELDEVGFLMGSVGIALVLLAAISEAPPGWDRLLLLS